MNAHQVSHSRGLIPFFDCWTRTAFRVLTPVTLIPPIRAYSYYYNYSVNNIIYSLNVVIYSLNAIICSLNAAIYLLNGGIYSAPYSRRVLTPVTLLPPIPTTPVTPIPPIPTYSYRAIFSPIGAPYSLRYQANGSAYIQQMLGDRWLIEARTLALDNEALTDPHDLEVVKEALLLYVLYCIHNSVYETCLTYVSAEDMRLNLKTKRGFSRLQRAQKYCRTAKDVLQFVKVTVAQPWATNFLTNS